MIKYFWLIVPVLGLQLSYAQNKQFIPRSSGGSCCCGQFVELFYPNLDFEEAPSPPPGGLITYWLGESFSGWTVTRASIDHKDAFFGNLTLGNPNGRSNFIDLHGSPGFGAIEYNLTGLTAGNTYRIDFWTAQNGSGYTSTGTLKIAGGAWLTGNWIVDTDGSILWFKVSFMFTAKASTAKMEFSSIGGNEWGGTLIDDIKIFECPGDTEAPQISNPQDDLEFECEQDVPKAAQLIVTDNCDQSPQIAFKETFETPDPCTKIITRSWEVSDHCGNTSTVKQIITVADKTPPDFTKVPQNKSVFCTDDVNKLFNDWIKKNGDGIATDNCGKVNWRASVDHNPAGSCDTVIVEFIVADHCGQEKSAFANFYIVDTIPPAILKKAEDRFLQCNPNARDSLRLWLMNHGYADAKDNCDTAIWWTNFNGDSTKNAIRVSFYVKDRCGNVDSTVASFVSRSSSDTFRISLNSCSIPQSASDTMVYTSNGCDSIVITNTIRIPSDTTHLQFNTCDPNQYRFDSLILKNTAGCDSLVIMEFIFRPTPMTTRKDSSCSIQAFFADTLSLSGQYCDSLVITQHYPLRNDSVFIIQTSCDSSQRGTVINHFQNYYGCDSIVSIRTDYSAQSVTVVTTKECGLSKGYTDTLTFSTLLCDSLVITNHIPLKKDSVFQLSHTCDPNQSGIFISHWINSAGCDSVVTLNNILDPRDSSHVLAFSCNSAEVGIVKQNLRNQFGCDSVIYTETRLIPGDSSTIQTFTCELNKAGTSKSILKNKSGCDSTVIVNTVFIAADTNYIMGTTCKWNQQKRDTVIYTTATCDSLVITLILFIPSDTIRINSTTCKLSEAGLDSITLTNSYGCDSLIYFNKQYVPLSLKIQLDSISCFHQNDGGFQILNPSDFTKPYEVFLNNQIIQNTSSVSSLGSGNYRIFIRDQKGCVTDTVNFNLDEPAEFITELGNDLEVKQGTNITLNLQSNRNVSSINWFPVNLGNCTNCSSIQFIADQDIWVYSLALDDRNCVSRDSIFIRVKKSGFVYAPNAISANGDNINDHFYLIADDQSQIELLQIYDRWGELLFEAQNILPNNPESGWDGTFHSEKMNPGVYIYYAKIKSEDGSEQILKGDFTLIR